MGGGLLLSWVGHDIVPSFPLFKSYTDNGVTFGISTPFTAPANYQGSYSNSESSSGNNLTVTSGVPVGIGNDTIYGGTGNSQYYLSNGNNYLDAGGGNDKIQAGVGNNTIFGGTGNDTIWGGGGTNYINTESGNDFVVAQGGNNLIIGGTGNDTIYSGINSADWATSFISENNYIYGGSGNSKIYGAGGNDTLIGGTGNTSIYGGAGNEYIVGGDGNVLIYGGNGNDTIYAGGNGNDTIFAGNGHNTIYGGNGTDSIVGGTGNDLMMAGDGGTAAAPTILYAGSGTGILYGGAGVDQLVGGSGTDTMIAGTGTSTLQGGTGTEVMYSSIGNATLIAGSGSDTLYGGSGTDWLLGRGGNTVFVAGTGNETIYGGTGSNTYRFNAGFGNVELINANGGDTFQFGAGISLANLTVTAAIGSNGNPALLIQTSDGGTLVIDNGLNGAISQFAFASGGQLSLADLMAKANSTPTSLAGTNGNLLFSATSGDALIGGTGNDTLYGFNGNDTLTAGSGNQTLYGESANNLLTAGAGNDTLISAGNSTLVGGTGDTTFVVQNNTDVIQAQLTGSNTNTVKSSVNFVLPDNVQNLTLLGKNALTGTGNTLANTITANSGNDVLIAGSGIATLVGGTGNDTFIINNAADVVQAQSTGTNVNTVLSSVSYVLPDNVQNLTLTGTADLTATGNNLNNVITANGGNDTLIAGSGNDELIGGFGNDWLISGSGTDTLVGGIGQTTFLINNSRDVITQQPNNSSSSVMASVNYVLPQNVNTLTLTGNANLTAIGNNENDVITGNAGNDTLVAGSGNDTLIAGSGIATMIGGIGNNTFIVNNAADVVQAQSTGTNINTIQSSVSYSLINTKNVQNLTLTGNANLTATGTSSSTTITANNGDDTLIAGSGNDTLIAGSGNSTLIGGSGQDTFVMRYGMGASTLIDTSAQGGIIQLQPGIQLSDLTGTKQGNDLLMQLNGTNTSFLLQGYYTAPQIWTIEDGAGNAATAQHVVDATTQQLALQASNSVSQLESNFIAQAKAYDINDLINNGFMLQPDGTWFYQKYAQLPFGTYFSDYISETSSYTSLDALINNQGSIITQSSSSFGRSFLAKAGRLNEYSGTINVVNTNANDAVIYADSMSSNTSYGTRAVPVSWSVAGGPVSIGYMTGQNTSQIYGFYNDPLSPSGQTFGVVGVSNNAIQQTDYMTFYQSSILPAPLTAAVKIGNITLPTLATVNYTDTFYTSIIQEINVGAGNHTVYGGVGYHGAEVIVNAGSGNDLIYNNGFSYGGTGNSTIIGSGTLMAGTGSDILISQGANDTIIAGSGDDAMFASAMGGTTININANNTGVDLIGGAGSSSDAVLNAFYVSQGISNWEESYCHPDQYSYVQSNGKYSQTVYVNVQDATAYAADNLGFTLSQAMSEGLMHYISPLPVLAIAGGSVTTCDAYYTTSHTPQINFSANDFNTLAPYYMQGVIPTSHAQLGAGITLANLQLS